MNELYIRITVRRCGLFDTLCTYCIIILLLIYASNATNIPPNVFILEPYAESFVGASFSILPRQFNITNRLVRAEPRNACKPIRNPDQLKGSIAFIYDDSCDPVQKAVHLYQAGAVGMLMSTFAAYSGPNYWEKPTTKQNEFLHLPSLAITHHDGSKVSKLLKDHPSVIISMNTPNGHPWIDNANSASGMMFQVGLIVYITVSLSVATYKLYYFIVRRGLELSVAQCCLFIEIFAAIIRLVYFVDPLLFRGIYNRTADQILLNLSFPFTLSATLLIIFYWHEVLCTWSNTRDMMNLTNLNKMRIPFILVVVLAFFIEIGGSLSRTYLDINPYGMNITNSILVGVVSFGVSIYFFVIGIKVVRVSFEHKAKLKAQRVSKVSICLILSGISLAGYSVSVILLISPLNWVSVRLTLVSWGLVYGFLSSAGFFQILSFEIPEPEFRSVNLNTFSPHPFSVTNRGSNLTDTIEGDITIEEDLRDIPPSNYPFDYHE